MTATPGAPVSDSTASQGEARAAFMARIRAALGRHGPFAPEAEPPQLDEAIVRLVQHGADLPSLFAQRAALVGLKVHRTTSAAAGSVVLGLLRAVGGRRIVSSLDSSPATAPVHALLAREGFEFIDWKSGPGFGPQYDAAAGLTGVEAAIAESGTLVCTPGPGRARGLSLVPPVHIAIVRASQIVPDLIDFWRTIPTRPADLPSSLVLITGPSKTADIEGVLITGVHGPREVHVVLVEDA